LLYNLCVDGLYIPLGAENKLFIVKDTCAPRIIYWLGLTLTLCMIYAWF